MKLNLIIVCSSFLLFQFFISLVNCSNHERRVHQHGPHHHEKHGARKSQGHYNQEQDEFTDDIRDGPRKIRKFHNDEETETHNNTRNGPRKIKEELPNDEQNERRRHDGNESRKIKKQYGDEDQQHDQVQNNNATKKADSNNATDANPPNKKRYVFKFEDMGGDADDTNGRSNEKSTTKGGKKSNASSTKDRERSSSESESEEDNDKTKIPILKDLLKIFKLKNDKKKNDDGGIGKLG